MLTAFISRLCVLTFGVVYPAYKSYKALKSRDPKALVKMMMYWIIFAAYTSMETVADIFISWFPFYYEMKIIIFLIIPFTNTHSFLYRKYIHPKLVQYEDDIDDKIAQVSEKGYTMFMAYGAKTIQLAASTVLTTALKSQGMLVDTLKRSYSMSDISNDPNDRRHRALTYRGDDISEEEDDVIMRPSAESRRLTEIRKGRCNSSSSVLESHTYRTSTPRTDSNRSVGDKSRYNRANIHQETRNGLKKGMSLQNLSDLPELPEHDESRDASSEKVFIIKRGKIAQTDSKTTLSESMSDRQNRISRRTTTLT